jgi:hypothetical protein
MTVATFTNLAPETPVMGKHLPPQMRDPRTYWYGRTLWKNRRRDQLQREPLCQPCLRKGRVVLAVEVHHLIEFGEELEPVRHRAARKPLQGMPRRSARPPQSSPTARHWPRRLSNRR